MMHVVRYGADYAVYETQEIMPDRTAVVGVLLDESGQYVIGTVRSHDVVSPAYKNSQENRLPATNATLDLEAVPYTSRKKPERLPVAAAAKKPDAQLSEFYLMPPSVADYIAQLPNAALEREDRLREDIIATTRTQKIAQLIPEAVHAACLVPTGLPTHQADSLTKPVASFVNAILADRKDEIATGRQDLANYIKERLPVKSGRGEKAITVAAQRYVKRVEKTIVPFAQQVQNSAGFART